MMGKILITTITILGVIMILNSSSSSTYILGNEEIIRSAVLTDKGTLEVVRTRGTGTMYVGGGEPPHYLIKETYVAKDGKIVLEKTEKGSYYPASYEKTQERYEWE